MFCCLNKCLHFFALPVLRTLLLLISRMSSRLLLLNGPSCNWVLNGGLTAGPQALSHHLASREVQGGNVADALAVASSAQAGVLKRIPRSQLIPER